MANNQPDIEQDSVPSAEQWNAPQSKLIDVAVIYTQKDYMEVTEQFVPWLKDIAKKCKGDDVVGARIHLYDDPDVTPEHNIFSQTTSVSKCMKILVFLTDNFEKDKILKGVVEELIMMTRLISEKRVEEHVSKMCGEQPQADAYVRYLSECVKRQKETAMIPVKAQENITFVGLETIVGLPYYERDISLKSTERRAENILKLAVKDRKRLEETFPGRKQRNYKSSQERPNTSSREHQQGSSYEPQNTCTTKLNRQVNFNQNGARGHPQRNRVQDNAVSDSSAKCNSPSMKSLVPNNQSVTNNNQVTADTANNDIRAPNTGSSQENQTSTSTKTKTPEHDNPAVTSDQATENSRPDIEDQLESGQANNTDNTDTKTVLTESGYGSLPGQGQMKQNDGATPVTELSNDTSLENTSLVNDCGDAALGKDPDSANLNTSEENIDGESSYTDMPEQPVQGLIAGSVSQSDKRYCPDGSDVPDSTSHWKGDDLSSLDVNRWRQFEVENIPGPSLSDESLAASGEITTLTQQSDVREPGGAAEGQGQGHTTPHICFIEGPQPESELQTNSLFVSTLDQHFIHKRTMKTNTLSMMSKNVIFLHEGRTEHHYEYDEVD